MDETGKWDGGTTEWRQGSTMLGQFVDEIGSEANIKKMLLLLVELKKISMSIREGHAESEVSNEYRLHVSRRFPEPYYETCNKFPHKKKTFTKSISTPLTEDCDRS